MDNNLKKFATMFITLFLVMIAVALTYIGADHLKGTACEQQDTGYDWYNTDCYATADHNETVTVTSVDKIGVIESAIEIALGLVGLFVLVSVFKLVFGMARGMFKAEKW